MIDIVNDASENGSHNFEVCEDIFKCRCAEQNMNRLCDVSSMKPIVVGHIAVVIVLDENEEIN